MDNEEKQSFIRTYDEDTQEELEAVVNKQLQEIKEKSEIDSLINNISQNKERVTNNFEQLSKDRGDQNKFLVLVQYNENSEEKFGASRDWEIFNNRKDTYQYLKDSIEDLDLNFTRVVAETLPFTNDLSAGSFMVYCLDSGKIEDNFDPRGEYLPEDFEMEV